MAHDPLATYLRDHFAGSRLAIDLLDSLRKEHEGDPLADFAAEMRSEIEEDRLVLNRLIERVGSGQFVLVKESAAFLVEKLSWVKLRSHSRAGLGNLEALEIIALGILGKKSLWRTLASIASSDARLGGVDFERLIQRADEQHARVEERRLQIARSTLPNRRAGQS